MNISFIRLLAAAAGIALLTGLVACNSTTLETAWKAPEVGSIKFSKVLVVGIAPVNSLRRPIEDAMKAQITAVPAVASYELLPDPADQLDAKKIGAALQAGGFDGLVTMRMIAFEDEVTYNPGGMVPTGYTSFYSYYTPGYALAPYYRSYPGAYMGAPMAYEYVPPSVTTDHIMSIETNIYDARDGKLIWTGMSRTINPSESDNLIADVVGVVKAKLREQKLIP
jgi:hypothetical protein